MTLSIDSDVLRRARVRAVAEETSVNALVRDFIGEYADEEASRRRAVENFLQLARDSRASSGPQGRTWTRADLHER